MRLSEQDRIRSLFLSSRFLDFTLFMQYIEQLRLDIEPPEVDLLFDEFDKRQSGKIDGRDFLAFINLE